MAEGDQGTLGDGPFSIGGYLKTQRKIRGIELEELSVRTRIPLRSLSRLEDGAFDGNADGFVRGFVRTVSDGLGLDPDDTLMRMLAEPAGARVARATLGLPLRAWVAVFVGLLAAAFGLVLLNAALATTAVEREPERMLRRDPVRALAEAHAASGVAATAATATGGSQAAAGDDASPRP